MTAALQETCTQQPAAPCRRCKDPDAPHKLRSLPTCRACVVDYVESKVVKRFGILTKETRTTTKPVPRRYLAGLSFGPSSSALTELLDKTAKYHASRKASSPFEPLVVHVDTDLSRPIESSSSSSVSSSSSSRDTPTPTPAQQLLARYRETFTHTSFECVHLTAALGLKTIDWSALPAVPNGPPRGHNRPDDDSNDDNDTQRERLRRFLDTFPSASSRADVLRLLIRHILLHVATQRSYSALLMAHNTTTLASLTLAQVANGRGFAVPWEVNDGPFTVCTYDYKQQHPEGQDPEGQDPASRSRSLHETFRIHFPIYYPMREVLKNEVLLYVDLVPCLKDLVPRTKDGGTTPAAVVSHRDLSIEDVMTRYFDNVEGPHSGIIANVVRITGKLDRSASEPAVFCRLCGIPLDEDGDSRWAGELGDAPGQGDEQQHRQLPNKLCYGCKRSING